MAFEIILQTIPDAIREIGVTELISLLLTAALVFLYWRMQRFQEIIASIQKKQTDLMKEQADLMAVNHQPVIELNSINALDDLLNVSILNTGNGPARNLLVQCVMYRQDGEADIGQKMNLQEGYVGTGPVLGPKWNYMIRESAFPLLEGGDFDGPSDGIQAGEGPVEFSAEISFKYMIPNKTHDLTFSEAIQRISQDWDSEFLAMDIHLAYVNLAQKAYTTPLVAIGNIPLDGDLTLEDVFEKGEMIAPLDEPISEDEIATMLPIDTEDIQFG